MCSYFPQILINRQILSLQFTPTLIVPWVPEVFSLFFFFGERATRREAPRKEKNF